MRLALLGVDDEMLAVAASLNRGSHDEVVMIDALAARAAEAAKVARKARLVTEWEHFLDSDVIDAVLVASDNPTLRVDQLRKLLQVGMSVLVSHPVSLSMLDCYELDMIRRDTHSVVVPNLPARLHPAIAELQSLLNTQEQSELQSPLLGTIDQLVFERFLADRSRESVLRQFARDADLMQLFGGDAMTLHALGSGALGRDLGPYGNLAVQLACQRGVVCRWSVAPVEEQPGGRLTLVGSSGKAMLSVPMDRPWRMEIRSTQATLPFTSKDFPAWDGAAAAIDVLAAAIEGRDVHPTWSDAARTVELTETIDISLARGRTIDLHREDFTDIGTFKGTMTSLGCGLLVVGLTMTVLVAIAAGVAAQMGWNQLAAVLDKWPILLLAVCGAFLLLQIFGVLAGRSRKEQVVATTAPTGNESKHF
jgi:predicted dehydrogenase